MDELRCICVGIPPERDELCPEHGDSPRTMPPFPDIDPDLAREQPVATLRYEEHEETGRIWIDATFDGDTLSSLHTSGPKGDVRDYFDGLLTKIELRRKWRMDP